MNSTELTSKLWQDLSEKVDPRTKPYVNKLRRKYSEAHSIGEEVGYITETSVYQTALEMLISEAELMAYRDKLHIMEEKRNVKEKEFWLEVYDTTGLNGEEHLMFDPASGTIRKQNQNPKEPPDSYKATLEGFKELIENALLNPLFAGQMAEDMRLPSWLRHMARCVISGDFKPNLRQTIEECIAEPAIARQWNNISADRSLPTWFVEMTEVLGARKKYEL